MSDVLSPPFYILIATTGDRPERLERTLASLAQCRRPAGYRRTIVVENGGGGGQCEALVQRFADPLNSQYLYQPQGNKSLALNHGLASIDRGLVYFTDDDVRFEPDVLTAYADAAARAGAGVDSRSYFGGSIGIDYPGGPPPQWLLDYLPSSAVGFELPPGPVAPDAPRFIGFNWAAFAEDVKPLGGFNTEMGPGAPTGMTIGEEGEMQDRLRAAGCEPRYVPEARVWHWVPPEQCSPDWALQRRYRHAVSRGARAAAAGRFGFRWCGPLADTVHLTLRAGVSRLRHLTAPPDQRAFAHRFYLNGLRGIRDGYRAERERRSTLRK